MVTNLKDNIWIKGFDTNGEAYNFKDSICYVGEPLPYIYIGKTSEITKDIANIVCDWMFWDEKIEQRRYKNYLNPIVVSYPFLTSNTSILSACDKPYCIIYKK